MTRKVSYKYHKVAKKVVWYSSRPKIIKSKWLRKGGKEKEKLRCSNNIVSIMTKFSPEIKRQIKNDWEYRFQNFKLFAYKRKAKYVWLELFFNKFLSLKTKCLPLLTLKTCIKSLRIKHDFRCFSSISQF